ncbi:hypothetical protein Tco_0882884, partial [Tanacetum coccineum]
DTLYLLCVTNGGSVYARMESGSGNEDSEVQRTMLELLNQLDGFEASNKIKLKYEYLNPSTKMSMERTTGMESYTSYALSLKGLKCGFSNSLLWRGSGSLPI